ncbi:MAG: cytochrome C oxidase subunit IV family protein [Acidimicrobiia bacterium]|nr:cytochrome C oxidase subunit IV family protein [Acidimicrobiia bacterium]
MATHDTPAPARPATETHDGGRRDHPEAGHRDHPGDGLYIRIAIILAVFTAVEIALPYVMDDGILLVVPLLLLMVVKFGIIASFFMHLRFDSKVLTRLFYGGLFLAVGVYVAALATFRVFN